MIATFRAIGRSRDMQRDTGANRSTDILYGALAGFAATAAMTAAMWRLHRRLPQAERYPLPPREIVEILLPPGGDGVVRDTAMTSHFLYGAVTGALVGAVHPPRTMSGGAVTGAAVWAASYFGWIPAAGILKPASEHPPRRNALMIAAHLVWGGVTALILRELHHARATILNDRPPQDAARSPPE